MLIILFILSCFIFLALIIFIFLTFFKITEIFFTDAPFIPTTNEIIDDIIENLKLTNKSVLYDLGCGDARILIRAVELKPNIRAVGVEVAYLPYLLAKFFTGKHKQIKILREDIFKTNISDATHIFLYLYPKAVNKLIENIKKQCKPGTLVISCDFEIESYKPTNIVDLKNKHSKLCQKLFIYNL